MSASTSPHFLLDNSETMHLLEGEQVHPVAQAEGGQDKPEGGVDSLLSVRWLPNDNSYSGHNRPPVETSQTSGSR